MKKIFLIATIIAGTGFLSSAQSESKYAKNYKVCRGATGYEICSKEGGETIAPPISARNEFMKIEKASVVHESIPTVPCTPPANYPIGVNRTDVPQPPVSSRPNDRVDKNNRRNLNYGSNAQLPPNNGRYTE